MNQEREIILVGFSHRTAPVAVRERFSVNTRDLGECVQSLSTDDKIEEAFVLSTCNRTEALVAVPRGQDVSQEITSRLYRNIDRDHLYTFRGIDAVIHLFRVAAGLDSMVLGESEILAQLRRSYDVAREQDSLGQLLEPLLRHALGVGKRVRTETSLGHGTLSVARVGVEIASTAFGSFDNCHATIVGAGETGVLVARHLRDLGIGGMTVLNRTLERASSVALEFGANAFSLDDLSARASRTDLIVCAIDGQEAVLTLDKLDKRKVSRRDRPLLIIDLSVPRAVAPEVGQLSNVLLYDLDDLGHVVERNLSNRKSALIDSDRILVAEMHKFLALRTFKTFTPAITSMRERFESVREEVLDNVAGGTAEARQVQLAHELSKRLLDVALSHMKESARYTQSESALENEYQRYLENL